MTAPAVMSREEQREARRVWRSTPRTRRYEVARATSKREPHPDAELWAHAVQWAAATVRRWRRLALVMATVAVLAIAWGVLARDWVPLSLGMVEAVCAVGLATSWRAATTVLAIARR